MKTFGGGAILRSGTVDPKPAIHFSLSQPVSVVIVGMDKPEVLTSTLQAANTFQPLSSAQQQTLLARTATAAQNGEFEAFKTTPKFDGTAHNPSCSVRTDNFRYAARRLCCIKSGSRQ